VFFAIYGRQAGEVAHRIVLRSPLLLTGSADLSSLGGGFSANVLISLLSMLIALVAGSVLGACLISPRGLVRVPSILLMNLLRNSPWLVLLYAILYLLPFELYVFGTVIVVSPLAKATVGLALPVTAYVAEVVRGGVQAIPSGQWESARALGYRRSQVLRYVVVPQALPIMIPSLMTTYAALFIGTSLVVVTGTADVLSLAKTVIGSDGDRYASGIYLYVLLLFFLFAFPIAIGSRVLERRVGARA
jgi:polar amino acid transport system permease protein